MRDRCFMFSDLTQAAEDFVATMAEFSDPMWEPEDEAEVVTGLVNAASEVIGDPDVSWGTHR